MLEAVNLEETNYADRILKKPKERIWRRVWAWCRRHWMILLLLAIIALQQFFLLNASLTLDQ